MNKFLVIVLSILFASTAFGGGRKIVCKGTTTQFEILAKGPSPIEKNVSIHGLSEDLVVTEVIRLEGSGPYDFNVIYQSDNLSSGYVLILKYVDDVFSSSIFKNGKEIEKTISCQLEWS